MAIVLAILSAVPMEWVRGAVMLLMAAFFYYFSLWCLRPVIAVPGHWNRRISFFGLLKTFFTNEVGALFRPDLFQAIGSWVGVGVAGAMNNQRGCVLARTGAGVYTATLDNPLNTVDGIILTSNGRGAPGNTNISVTHTSDTVKTISDFVIAAATDEGFDFLALKVSAGASLG
jgi:hypothetical protein